MSVMPPPGFKYMKAFLAGRPTHTPFDGFYHHHPPMDRRKRSKIFAPFDALEGYSDSCQAMNINYEERIDLSETNKNELNRRLTILSTLTSNGKLSRQNRVEVSVTYYKPCTDQHRFAWQMLGTYVTETGICWKVDTEIDNIIKVGETTISLKDVTNIKADDESLFRDEFSNDNETIHEYTTPNRTESVNQDASFIQDTFDFDSQDVELCEEIDEWIE